MVNSVRLFGLEPTEKVFKWATLLRKTLSYQEQVGNRKLQISAFAFFDLAEPKGDNRYMSDAMMQDTELQQIRESRRSTRVGVLAVTLGLTASLLASPTVKRESTVSPEKTQADTATPKRHWFQIGKASWYGGSFNGRLTANGETYDMYDFTCAHKTLPLGSWIRVTNLKNKRWTFLRVNDRGPMVPGRIVDLSYAAAQKLGIEGLGKVRIEQVNPSDPKLADQMVAQVRLDDPVKLQHDANSVDTSFLTPGMLTAAAR